MVDIFPKGTVKIDAGFIDILEARVSILDWSFLRSDTMLHIMFFTNGKVFFSFRQAYYILNALLVQQKNLDYLAKLQKNKLRKFLLFVLKIYLGNSVCWNNTNK